MPGIFGIIEKTLQPEDKRASALSRMLMFLSHMPWYHADTRMSSEGYAFGSVSVGQDREIRDLTIAGKDYIFLLDGYVYAVDGVIVKGPHEAAPRIISGINRESSAFLPRVCGNYSIAIYCRDTRDFMLFNDRMGPRRIYYADLGDILVFAPEVKAISFLPGFNRELDWKGLADFFNYGYVLGDKTFFRDIKSLPSASALTCSWHPNALRVEKYWCPEYSEKPGSMMELSEMGYSLLRDSIAEKVAHADSVISPISGGLDSRIILAALKESHAGIPIKPVTYGQRFSSEYTNARKVCSRLGFDNHSLVDINPKDLLPVYSPAVWLSEGMIPMLNCHLLLLPEALGNTYACLLNGIYGGPTNYSAEYYREDHLAAVLGHEEKAGDIRRVIQIAPRYYDTIFRKPASVLIKEHSLKSISDELNNHLHVSDRFCNQRDAFFIENRMRRFICQSSLYRFFWEEQLPLSNYGLYDFYLSTPPEMKLHRELLKTMLRKKFPAVARIRDANTGLNLFEQPTAWYRRKRKFAHDLRYYVARFSMGRINFYDKSTYAHYGKWFQKHKPTYDFYKNQLCSKRLRDIECIDGSVIDGFMQDVRVRGYGFDTLARLATFSIWYKLFVLEQGIDEIREQAVFLARNFR